MRNLNTKVLNRLYCRRFSKEEQAAKSRLWHVLCENFLQRYIARTDTVLDLACGYGEFINAVFCGRAIAYDLNPACATQLLPHVEFHPGTCLDLSALPDASVDVVFESNLLEHLSDKDALLALTQEVYRVLRSGGKFLVLQPNILYVGHAYWNFIDHTLPLTHRSLAELLESQGLKVTTNLPRFLPYTTKNHLPQNPQLLRWYLRCPWLWPLFGAQCFLVGQR